MERFFKKSSYYEKFLLHPPNISVTHRWDIWIKSDAYLAFLTLHFPSKRNATGGNDYDIHQDDYHNYLLGSPPVPQTPGKEVQRGHSGLGAVG